MRGTVKLLYVSLFILMAVPGWAFDPGAKKSAVADTAVASLKPGQFIWVPEVAPSGPMTIVVNLQVQRAYVYRNGIRIGASTISSGKKGHETPTGVFTILQKNKDHRSNLYNNAPMPYSLWLTRDGVAIHGSNVRWGFATHGCVGVPTAFAAKLFASLTVGDDVLIVPAKARSRKI